MIEDFPQEGTARPMMERRIGRLGGKVGHNAPDCTRKTPYSWKLEEAEHRGEGWQPPRIG